MKSVQGGWVVLVDIKDNNIGLKISYMFLISEIMLIPTKSFVDSLHALYLPIYK